MAIDINRPAKYLTGKTLDDGWIVGENVTKTFIYGSKSFSESYLVEKDGQKALLKALDFSIAMIDPDPTSALIQLSKSYDFEKELLELCKSHKLTRIIKIIAQGKISPFTGSIIPAPYFILEYAEKDVKSMINLDSRFNTVWLLKILHNVTIGLWQIHNKGVAHKNLTPENIMEFSKDLQKITELGNSDMKGVKSPNENYLTTGDPAYLTPEFMYGQVETDWIYKSQATDVYQLGSLIYFLFTQSNFNTWLFHWLDDLNPDYRPGKWGGTYEQVLPYLIVAYDKAMYQFATYVEDEQLKKELEVTLRQLCHPDPKKRGHPKNFFLLSSPLSVERYISQFNKLAKSAELKLSKT